MSKAGFSVQRSIYSTDAVLGIRWPNVGYGRGALPAAVLSAQHLPRHQPLPSHVSSRAPKTMAIIWMRRFRTPLIQPA